MWKISYMDNKKNRQKRLSLKMSILLDISMLWAFLAAKNNSGYIWLQGRVNLSGAKFYEKMKG